MVRTPYEAGGFAFSDEKMMEKAVKEGEGIRYIRNSADMRNPQMVFEVYCQMVSQGLFETPVGYVYLHELQEFLMAAPSINNRDIPPIPVVSYRQNTNRAPEPKRQPVQTKTKTKVVHKTKVKNIDYKPWFKASISLSVILLLIVIGMFAVTATSGNINIINYENALIEKYENWETQLNDREAKLKEREQKLNHLEEAAEETAP